MSTGRDIPYLKGAAKFVERLPDYLLRLLWITRENVLDVERPVDLFVEAAEEENDNCGLASRPCRRTD
jgi:hypothetical protein